VSKRIGPDVEIPRNPICARSVVAKLDGESLRRDQPKPDGVQRDGRNGAVRVDLETKGVDAVVSDDARNGFPTARVARKRCRPGLERATRSRSGHGVVIQERDAAGFPVDERFGRDVVRVPYLDRLRMTTLCVRRA